MKKDIGPQPTKKSEEEPFTPLVVFNRIGGAGRGHSFHPTDRQHNFHSAREGDIAAKRAKKKKHPPMYETGHYYYKLRKDDKSNID